jgi:hypothetical protein
MDAKPERKEASRFLCERRAERAGEAWALWLARLERKFAKAMPSVRAPTSIAIRR